MADVYKRGRGKRGKRRRYRTKTSDGSAGSTSTSSSSSDGGDDGPVPPPDPDDEPEDVPSDGAGGILEDVELHRAAWAWDEDGVNDFYVFNGAGAAAGAAPDCAIGMSRRGVVRLWCEAYGFKKTRAYYYTHYTQENANQLAREFCRRGQYYWNMYYESDDPDFVYTQEQIDSYEEDVPYLEWQAMLAEDSVCWDAIWELEGFKPW